MKSQVYVVINEGEAVFATNNEEVADAYAENAIDNCVYDTVEECGRDIDDLTPEELEEMSFMSGFDGGYYEVQSFELDIENRDNNPDTVELDDGTELDVDDIFDVYEESSIDN